MPTPDPLTGQIIGCCYRVANGLGYGFLEKCYENALAFELRKAKLAFTQQQAIEVFYEGEKVGKYFADLIVEGTVVVEIKAVHALDDSHVAQCLNDLRATGLATCLLVNFGKAKIEVRRLSMTRGKEAAALELDVQDTPDLHLLVEWAP